MPRRVTGSNAFRGAPCQLCAGTANGFHTCLSHPLGRSRPTQPAGGGGTPARSEAGAGRGVSGITHPTSPGGSLRAEHSSSPLRVAGFPPAAAGAEGRRRPAAPRPSASRPSASRPCGGAPLSAPRRRRSGGGPRPLSAGSAAAAWRDRGEARGQRVPRLCGRGRPAFRQSGAGRSLRLSARRGRGGSCHVLCAERRGKPARASVPRVAERGSCRRPARTLPLSRRCPSLPRPSGERNSE